MAISNVIAFPRLPGSTQAMYKRESLHRVKDIAFAALIGELSESEAWRIIASLSAFNYGGNEQ